MTDPHNIPFANHILSSIQKDLTVLKDHQVLDERTLQSILALLPTTANPRQSFTHSPSPSPSPAPSPVMNSSKPPLPTRKSTSTSHSPHSTPIPAPRTPSFPKLPVRRGTPDRQPPSRAIVNEPSALQPPSYTATEKNQQWAEAIFDYSGEDTKTDLSFRKGDKIQVTEHVNADWWRGTLHGKSGIFPQNHVQPLPSSRSVTPMVHPATEEQAPGKVHDMTKKFGSRVGEAAVFGFGATVGSEAAHAIF